MLRAVLRFVQSTPVPPPLLPPPPENTAGKPAIAAVCRDPVSDSLAGSEVDLDLGNYERYLSVRLTGDHNITTGKVYLNVIEQERRGAYLGRTVQIVPHVTDSIKDWIRRVAKIPVDGSGEEPDVCIIELG